MLNHNSIINNSCISKLLTINWLHNNHQLTVSKIKKFIDYKIEYNEESYEQWMYYNGIVIKHWHAYILFCYKNWLATLWLCYN